MKKSISIYLSVSNLYCAAPHISHGIRGILCYSLEQSISVLSFLYEEPPPPRSTPQGTSTCRMPLEACHTFSSLALLHFF